MSLFSRYAIFFFLSKRSLQYKPYAVHDADLLSGVSKGTVLRYEPYFYTPNHCTPQLRSGLAKQIASGAKEIDVLNWMTRTALELVGQGGLGWSFDSLEKQEENKLVEYIKAFT